MFSQEETRELALTLTVRVTVSEAAQEAASAAEQHPADMPGQASLGLGLPGPKQHKNKPAVYNIPFYGTGTHVLSRFYTADSVHTHRTYTSGHQHPASISSTQKVTRSHMGQDHSGVRAARIRATLGSEPLQSQDQWTLTQGQSSSGVATGSSP